MELDKPKETSKSTGLVYDDKFLLHSCPFNSEHYQSECPERLTQIHQRLKKYGLLERCEPVQVRMATNKELLLCHSQEYIDTMSSTATMSHDQLKELAESYDCVFIGERTFETACLAVGSLVDLTANIVRGKLRNGIAILRPPGHHAQANAASGYCIFNNVAIAAQYARQELHLERILIVDFDVHHGQGIQYLFEDDPNVLYFSIHGFNHAEHWPSLIDSNSYFIGKREGKGFNINVPWNEDGMGDAEYLAAFQQVLLPIAYEFSPQLVLVSSGADAAIADLEGKMQVTPSCYAHLVYMLMSLAEGKLCLALEGGYNLDGLAEVMAVITKTLLGDCCPRLPPQQQPEESAVESIMETIAYIQPFWKSLQYQKEYVNETNEPGQTRKMGSKSDVDVVKELTHLIAEMNLTVPQNRTCVVYNEKMKLHKCSFQHPERPDRISRIFERHQDWGLIDRCQHLQSRYATNEEIELSHRKGYIESIENMKERSFRELSKLESNYTSIYLHQETYDCARLAVGCVLNLIDEVLSGKSLNGTAIVRPPGHHAEINGACGFCFFNSVAIAAQYAKKHYATKRVLIVDWDIHHGNGTQNMFVDDPSVLYVSLHRYDNGFFFPGSKRADADKVGLNAGEGYNINIAWQGGTMGDAEYMAAFQQVIMPIAYEYAPDLVLVSAGFDAAVGDPLGGYNVTPEGYAHMTHMLGSLANGRVVLVLEGGYNLTSISNSMAMCTRTLLGDPCPLLAPELPIERAVDCIRYTLRCQEPYWKCLQFQRPLPISQSSQELNSGIDETVGNDVHSAKTPMPDGSTAVDDLVQSASQLSISSSTTDPEDSFASCSSDLAHTPGAAGDTYHTPTGKVDCPEDLLTKKLCETSVSKLEGDREPSTSSDVGVLGAVGGEPQPEGNKVSKDFLGNITEDKDLEMFAVVPLPWCPHLDAVAPLPACGLHVNDPCLDCCDRSENWVCLQCYKVLCGRYVKCHMVKHGEDSGHCIVLSYADLSVWCYGCDSYVHNQIVFPMKRSAHRSKFGEDIPGY